VSLSAGVVLLVEMGDFSSGLVITIRRFVTNLSTLDENKRANK